MTATPARDALIEMLTYSAVPHDESRKQVGAMLDDLRGRGVVVAALVESGWRPTADQLRAMGGTPVWSTTARRDVLRWRFEGVNGD